MSLIIQILVLICTCYFNHLFVFGSCEDVDELPSLDQRGISDIGSWNDRFISDEWFETLGTEGRYEMVSRDSITNLLISQSCGTNNPIYLDKTHPALEVITVNPITQTACLMGYTNDCEIEYKVQIRLCLGVLQYKLEETASTAAYCFELAEPIANIVLAPEDLKPDMAEVKPLLRYQGDTVFIPHLEFKCKFDKFNESLFYTAYWFINGNNFDLIKGPTNNIEDLNLVEKDILDAGFRLGIEIQCGIRVSTLENSARTKIITSSSFFAGVKVLTRTIVIKQSDNEREIVVETTVPVGCTHTAATLATNCFHELLMIDPHKTNEFDCTGSKLAVQPDNKDFSECGRRLTGELLETDDNWTGSTYSMKVKEVNDGTYTNIDEVFTLLLKMTQGTSAYHKIWKGYEIDHVTIIVEGDTSWHYRSCQTKVDPHHTTFDGECFDNQQPGDYILYKNIQYDIEVQQRNAICNSGRAYCACGVVARAGRDVFMVNLCNGGRVIDFLQCGDNILDVRLMDDKLTYRVYFPIGSYMEIRLKPYTRAYDNFLNIYIYASPKDLYNTQGLCGDFDGNIVDDLLHSDKTVSPPHVTSCYDRRHAFATSWEVQSDKNLFNLGNIGSLGPYSEEFMFCVCDPPTDPNAQTVSHNAICSKSNTKLCTLNNNFPTDSREKQCKISKKRSLEVHLQDIQRQLSQVDSNNLKFRYKRSDETDTVQVSNENIELCTNGISSGPVTQLDGKFDEALINASIDICAYDVSVANDTGFVTLHTTINNQVMSGYLGLDPLYRLASPDKVSEFLSQSCLNNCNDRGTCSDQGKCTCNEGYKGADCSIDTYKGMIMSDIQGGGLCDLNTEPECGRCITFTADDLADGYTCRFTIKETNTDGTYTTSEEDVTGVVEDIFNGECCRLSSKKKRSASISEDIFITSYALYLSNDGINFGSGMTLFAYDSSCQMYTGSGDFTVFTVKPGYCFIEGSCVDEGSVSTSDVCLSCSLQSDLYGWTSGCDTSSTTNENHTALIVGVCVGVVAGILLLIAMVFLLKYCKKDKQTVDQVNHTVNAKIKLEMSNSKTVYQRPPSASSTRDIDIGYELNDK